MKTRKGIIITIDMLVAESMRVLAQGGPYAKIARRWLATLANPHNPR